MGPPIVGTAGALSADAAAAGADLTVAIREAMDLPIGWGFGELAEWTQVRTQLRAHHHAIMAAIEARSADEAAELVDQHIWWAYEAIPRLHREH